MDWISDGITRIRNALMLNRSTVVVRGTKVMLRVLEIMKQEGFVVDYKMVEVSQDAGKSSGLKQACEVKLAYKESRPVIMKLKRVSKPSLRVYASAESLKPALRKFVVSVVSTSKGVMSGRNAIYHNIGGELICEVS